MSYDDVSTWSASKTLVSGEAAYSCMTILDDGRIGVLYEKGSDDTRTVNFIVCSLECLTDNWDSISP
ncbi:MAG: exo-alpha-sialidase [Planctomycetes bacterium]|nr:exo-alpha-sialidase [Planctomycetota bacterium]